MTGLALDSSVVVPLLLVNHRDHASVAEWWSGRRGAVAGHALAESYSVLTRLPLPMRAPPEEIARALEARFDSPLLIKPATAKRLPTILADHDVSGGAVYDALVALAAIEHDHVLATRDERARGTYESMGAQVLVVG